jgi:hypothetical protein
MSVCSRFIASFSRRASGIGVVLAALALLPGAAFPLTEFRRANSNFDDSVDISDALFTLVFLFLGGSGPVCDDALDANDDGTIDISDALYTLGYLFLGTSEPPAPGPKVPGPDPTPDELTCGVELRCDSPADGALVDLVPGAGVPIRGTAVGLSDVRMNGAPVEVAADGTFSATLDGRYGLNFVELSGTDRAGATHTALCSFLGAGRWLAEGDQLDEAVVYRFEPAGFNKLTSLLPAWFNANLSPRLDSFLATNLSFESDCGAFGSCVTEIRYLSLSAALDFVIIRANESQEILNIQIQLDLRLRLRVRSKLAGIRLAAVEGEVIVDNLPVDVDVSLGVDAVTGRPLAAGKNINAIDMSAASAQFPGLEPEFVGTVLSVARDSVQDSLGSEVLGGSAGLFEGLLAGTDITLPAAGFPVGRLDGAGSVTVALAPRWGVDLRNNGLTLLTGLRVVNPPPPPAATGRVPLPLAADPGSSPVPRGGTDVWSATHVGVFQQVLQALWRAGAFDGTVDGAALDPGLPQGTSLSVLLRLVPVVTGFDPTGRTGLDVGSLELIVTHPDLPPLLRVHAGARVRAQASFPADDLVFDDIAVDELHLSTGDAALDAASRSTLQGLVERLVVRLAGIALNDSLPILPTTAVTIPPSLGAYGLPVGSRLGGAPRLVLETSHVFLEGVIGAGP